MFDKHRKRRIIYNDDADQQYVGYDGYSYNITDQQSFIDARTTPAFDTHVDTYVWCLGNGAQPPWGALGHAMCPCLKDADHATELIVEACHQRGLEVWGSLRMNDIHDSFMADCLENASDPIKAQHPEYLIGTEADRQLSEELTERYLWTAFNFAEKAVRDYRLDYIEQQASMHDFDGFELDFTRFIWNFPMGQEAQLSPLMDELISEARKRLDAIGEKRGRPYTFVVHVMDSPEKSRLLGQNVETWLQQGLVDVLTVGMGYFPCEVRLDEYHALSERYGVPIYPSVNTNTYNDWFKTRYGPSRLERMGAWHEAIRGCAAWWWMHNAQGVYLFNLFCLEDKHVGPLDKDLVFQPLGEVGDAQTMANLDKLYGIATSSRGGFCHHGSEASALPVPLEHRERKLPLKIGPDADNGAKFTLHLWLTGGDDDTQLRVRLNHHLLSPKLEAPKGDMDTDAHYAVDVPHGVMHCGENELSVFCSKDLRQTDRPLICHEVLAHATYA